jgi:transposase
MNWTVAIGIDTHRDRHSACALDRLGRPLGELELSAEPAGYRALEAWAHSLGEPAFALEGSGSYGAGLARHVAEVGARVYECERPTRRDRRRGKSDQLDAAAAARRLLAGEGLAELRGFGPREQLRVLLLERRSAQAARTAALNQLHAVVITAPPPLRTRLERLRGLALAKRSAGLRSDEYCVPVLRRLGRRVLTLAEELDAVDADLAQLVRLLAPALLEECGVGPICAAQLLVSSGEPARMRSEAAFAALAGASPVDASSGRQQRHRLNRGGDRQLNAALYVIALNRKHAHEATRAYYERLLAGGKTKREALRCVKRMLARYFYRRLCSIETLELPAGRS